MNFTIIPLALALLGPGAPLTKKNKRIQKDTRNCIAIIASENLQPNSIICNENSTFMLSETRSSEILAEFLRQNNIETIESINTSWCEGK